MGLVHAQQVKPPTGHAYAQREIYCVMEYALTKPSMIIIAVGVEMFVKADHFARKGLVSIIPM